MKGTSHPHLYFWNDSRSATCTDFSRRVSEASVAHWEHQAFLIMQGIWEPFYSSPRGRLLNLWKPSTWFSNGDPLYPPSGSTEHQQTNIWWVSSNAIPRHLQALCRALCWREAGPKQPSMVASLWQDFPVFHHVGMGGTRNLFYFLVKHLTRSVDAFSVPIS